MLSAQLLNYAWTGNTRSVKHCNGLDSISVFLESIMGKSVTDLTIFLHLDRRAYLLSFAIESARGQPGAPGCPASANKRSLLYIFSSLAPLLPSLSILLFSFPPSISHPPHFKERFMNGQNGLSSSFVETVAGFTAGIVSTLCLHPLDLVKTRLQGTTTFSPS